MAGSLALQHESPRGHNRTGIKSTRKWPAGGIAHWTLPILKRMSKHYPAAVDRIGQIVQDPEHKDNFAACKLVIETLVQDEHVKKGMIEGGEIKITIQLAEQPRIVAAAIQGEATEVT
jgi:hypothetical protein